jgi:dsRNA-specific ribonuclease
MNKRRKSDGSLGELTEYSSGQYSFTCRTHSSLLSSPYINRGSDIYGYMYSFLSTSGEFGIVLPFELVPLPHKILQPCDKTKVRISVDRINTLQKFQWNLWKDLMFVPQVQSVENTLTNYYVVPLKDSKIHWEMIEKALQTCDPRLYALPSELYRGAIVQSLHKNQALWIVVDICDIHQTSTYDFITTLLGKDSPGLKEARDTHSHFPLSDLILTNPLKVNSLDSFRKLYKPDDISLKEDFAILFVKPIRDVRCRHKKVKDQQIFPNGTPILHTKQVRKFYLDVKSVEQLRRVYQSLYKVEEYSYFIEFCVKYDLKADAFYLVKQACTSPMKNQKSNYESLENLGDTVLKCATSLYNYVRHQSEKEGKLTLRRTNAINNMNLAEVSLSKRLFAYLKTAKIPESKVKPAFFNVDYKDFGNTVTHKFSQKMLADHVEALLGVFYLSNGLKGAINFLHKLDVIRMSDTWVKYLDSFPNNVITCLSTECLSDSLFSSTLTTDQLFPHPTVYNTSDLSDSLKSLPLPMEYKFKDITLLEEALTHKSYDGTKYNYERLEFLGDALLDLIILHNIFKLQDRYYPEELTLIKHMLVNKYQFGKCGVVLELYRYMKCEKSVKNSIDDYLQYLDWKEDIMDFGVYNDEPPKELSDIFESVIAAVFLDSVDLNLTSTIVMEILAKPILYIVKNRDQLKVNILCDLSVLCQRIRKTVRFETVSKKSMTLVTIYDEKDTLISHASHKSKIRAKTDAAKAAIKKLTEVSMISV